MAERSRWQMGQQVEWPKVAPYTVIQLVGEAGNIHVDQKGHYHNFWHRELPNGDIVLIHHGGPDGFGTLSAAKHQHERVILRYTGMMISIPQEQQGEIPQEEQTDGTPIVGGDFPTLALQLSKLRLPGEQQTLTEWIGVLQNVSQELPAVVNNGQLSRIRERLQELLSEKSLVRSTNRYKQAAVRSLTATGTRGGLLLGVNEAQMQLLRRAEQTVGITLGTMKRYNDLERLQTSWNGIVDKLPGMAAQVLKAIQTPGLVPDDRVERVININLFHEKLSLEGQLDQLKGEPYFSRAQEFIDTLSPVKRHWEVRDFQGMLAVLTEQTREIEIWRRRVKEEYEGVGFGRYNLS